MLGAELQPGLRPIVVSRYTDKYASVAERLRASLERFAIPHEILEVRDRGSWAANCRANAGYFADAVEVHGGPVWWMDADCEVRRPLETFDHDLCAVCAMGGCWTGVLLARPGALPFLRFWQSLCEFAPAHVGCTGPFHDALDEYALDLDFFALPSSYGSAPGWINSDDPHVVVGCSSGKENP